MIKKEFEVGRHAEIDVHLQSGRLEVRTGTEGVVTVEVDTQDKNFEVEQYGDRIFVAADQDSGWLSSRTAHVVITVPEGIDATVATASARIECETRLGNTNIKTASGDVAIETAQDVTIKTASGDVRIGTVERRIKVGSASGDARIETCERGSFSTASGDIRIGTATDSIEASTASGDLTVRRFEGRRAGFKSMSGGARIGVLAGTQVDLDVTLLSGKLRLPKAVEDGVSANRQMKIKAKLVSGDLTIKRVEA